jgi:hypothetical protein
MKAAIMAALGALTLLFVADARPSHAAVAVPHYCPAGYEYSPSRNACVSTKKARPPATKKKAPQ